MLALAPKPETADPTSTDGTLADVFALDIALVIDPSRALPAACTTNDGCAATCASSCASNE
jgi:FxLD family lantipeptide